MIDRYVYTGSLTTPPYTENLLWNVIPRVIPIKPSTLDLFSRSSNPSNLSFKNPVGYENREIQMRNNRDLFYVNASNATEEISTIS
jgi:carbonic anhydrase